MDYVTLKALKPSEYSDAADGFRAVSDMACAAKDRIDMQITRAMKKANEGEAADAADAELRGLAENFHYTQIECGLVSVALDGFAHDVGAARKKLDAVVEEARARKFTVNSDGSVSYPAAGEKTDGRLPEGGTVGSLADDPTAAAIGRYAVGIDPNPNARYAQEYADRIADALKEATEADEKWAPKLRALKADDDLTVSDRDWADTKKDTAGVLKGAENYLHSMKEPPKHGTPQENAEWWKSLTDEERAAYLAVHPDLIGWTDGLPATVRDEANRAVLAESRGASQVELDAWLAKEPTRFATIHQANPNTGEYVDVEVRDPERERVWQAWDAERRLLQGRIDGMDAIQNRFDATGKRGLPEAYLLGFSTEGDGRAIVANGNPDTADHQAVYVPGTGSELGNVDGDINRMVNVWREADAKAGGKSVSTITWVGYDAPDSVYTDAPFPNYAYDGAPKFNHFLDGLEASHSGESASHRTVIAHSYGTTLVGAAAQTGRLDADDIVFAGSPGVRVSSADEMDVPKGHVWNEDAKGDPVPGIGRWGHGGRRFVIPSDPEFGANQLTTDTEGHSGYWDENPEGPSQSLLNQALVVVGKGDDVPLKPPPDPWSHGR
ncbi:alpha/beta hydrolase [Streptomyces sp. NPDC004286]|uniref:alpha/beta hydrolase n=1 Tax=Streptomyces sp. NPDC004286 TaxID=3364696 RepID=UPI003693F3E1